MRTLIACLLLAFSVAARAEPPARPILLWGFQRGCEPLPDATREVQAWLEQNVTGPDARTYVLSPAPTLLGCQGEACARRVRRLCPQARGRVMGGTIEQNPARSLLRLRLWMYDLETGRTTYHDNFCQNCTTASSLKANAVELAQAGLAAPPGPLPQFCQPEEPARELPPRSNKIYTVVYGKDFQKEAIRGAVRRLVQQAGTEVPFVHLGREYTLPVLRQVLFRDPGAQVFGAEIQGNGRVELFLYDGPTELIEIQRVDCEACDRDSLLEQVRQSSLNVLSHCFGDSCARVARSRPPADACLPFEAPSCGGLTDDALPLPVPRGESATAPTISPGLAVLTKGVAWGFVAASAATTLALLAANYSSAGRLDAQPMPATNLLLPGVAATGVLTVVALGVAIPTTIVVDRARRPAAPPPPPDPSAPVLIQCPE